VGEIAVVLRLSADSCGKGVVEVTLADTESLGRIDGVDAELAIGFAPALVNSLS
jgi:hypothetical protein